MCILIIHGTQASLNMQGYLRQRRTKAFLRRLPLPALPPVDALSNESDKKSECHFHHGKCPHTTHSAQGVGL